MIGNILATFVDVVDEDKTYGFYHNSEHYYNTDYYTQNKHYFDELEKLAIEKDEQESRKDYLKVGSKWECVANCMIDKGAHSSEYVKNGDIVEIHYCDPELFVFIDEHRFLMIPTQQFLLCFKPIKEGD